MDQANNLPTSAPDQDAGWTIQQVFDIYNNDEDGERLGDFIQGAEAILKTHINQFNRIRLLTLLGTAFAAPADMANYHDQANSQWHIANYYLERTDDTVEPTLRELREMIDRLWDVIQEERNQSSEDDEDEEDDGMEEEPGVPPVPTPIERDELDQSAMGPDASSQESDQDKTQDGMLASRVDQQQEMSGEQEPVLRSSIPARGVEVCPP